MSDFPDDLKYASTHEWVRVNDTGNVTVGISDHAQELLGDVVFVELPDIGSTFSAKEELSVIESVKAASDIYAPLSGEILTVNELLQDEPETVNSSPYDRGWLFTLKPSDESELDNLLDAEAYSETCEQES